MPEIFLFSFAFEENEEKDGNGAGESGGERADRFENGDREGAACSGADGEDGVGPAWIAAVVASEPVGSVLIDLELQHRVPGAAVYGVGRVEARCAHRYRCARGDGSDATLQAAEGFFGGVDFSVDGGFFFEKDGVGEAVTEVELRAAGYDDLGEAVSEVSEAVQERVDEESDSGEQERERPEAVIETRANRCGWIRRLRR